MKDQIKKYLMTVGLIVPESQDELKIFDEAHRDKNHLISEESIDPYKVLKEVKKDLHNLEMHKRTVLAAEIVYQLKDDIYLGHIKLQKLIFLCQEISNISLRTDFLKQAMGPYDRELMRSLDYEFLKRKWFEYSKETCPKYSPLLKCGEHRDWFKRYFKEMEDGIIYIIETFKGYDSNHVELVGTLFACWQELITDKTIITRVTLLNKVYDWHESKVKFSENQINNAINWMKEKNIVPPSNPGF